MLLLWPNPYGPPNRLLDVDIIVAIRHRGENQTNEITVRCQPTNGKEINERRNRQHQNYLHNICDSRRYVSFAVGFVGFDIDSFACSRHLDILEGDIINARIAL